MRHRTDEVPRYLKIHRELKKQVGIEEDADDQDTKRFKQVERVPEDVGMRIFQPPFDERTNRVVDGKPKA